MKLSNIFTEKFRFFILTFMFFYLIFCFYEWNFNPGEWTILSRVAVILLTGFVSVGESKN